jgi:RimJ/RimL family protein N-acetyltransferase
MILVDCISEYWEFVRLLRTHPENENWFFTQIKITSEQQAEYMSKNSDRYKICLLDEEPVGYIGVIKENEITYCVDPNFKGKGVGTFMVSEFMKQHDTLTAFIFPQNIASSKVFEKLGFKKQNFYSYEKRL